MKKEYLGRIGIIVAARSSSTRLPRKALLELRGIPMLTFLLKRLKSSSLADEIILATSSNGEDDCLSDIAKKEGLSCFRGSLNDVVDRYVRAADEFRIDTVVRVTGDCPFLNGEVVDYSLKKASETEFDLCSTKGYFPVGLDVEIYHAREMKKIHLSNFLNLEHREHLTLHYYEDREKYKIVYLQPKAKWKKQNFQCTIDFQADLEKANLIVENFDNINFSISELISMTE